MYVRLVQIWCSFDSKIISLFTTRVTQKRFIDGSIETPPTVSLNYHRWKQFIDSLTSMVRVGVFSKFIV